MSKSPTFVSLACLPRIAIKAKLEVVASGIETFEEAFLANIVTDDGATVYERIVAGNLKLLEPVR